MNAPETSELFIVPDGVRKVTIKDDTKIKNAAMVVVQKEDHTLGNLLRMQLHRDPDVLYSGYRMPHPLDHSIELKIQASDRSTPTKALLTAIGDLSSELSLLEERFRDQLRKFNEEQENYM
eukprot:TRINITY_DN2862_c0_g1_i1.p2 TRINITY_DN2862_c0_g1~~TRINITY_DN2862_c0_g1_i1.p2  ORF type:complete len:121 (+),score=50.15 TRINITY_DN2862_c0_g1_i1:15-377(+)